MNVFKPVIDEITAVIMSEDSANGDIITVARYFQPVRRFMKYLSLTEHLNGFSHSLSSNANELTVEAVLNDLDVCLRVQIQRCEQSAAVARLAVDQFENECSSMNFKRMLTALLDDAREDGALSACRMVIKAFNDTLVTKH